MEYLSIRKGSLTEEERNEINEHVKHTYEFLKTLPWTSEFRKVPEIAWAHHEKLDGSGYPRKLVGRENIPVQSRMMTISDIYDALTAIDRPYKKSVPVERALDILVDEAKARARSTRTSSTSSSRPRSTRRPRRAHAAAEQVRR